MVWIVAFLMVLDVLLGVFHCFLEFFLLVWIGIFHGFKTKRSLRGFRLLVKVWIRLFINGFYMQGGGLLGGYLHWPMVTRVEVRTSEIT